MKTSAKNVDRKTSNAEIPRVKSSSSKQKLTDNEEDDIKKLSEIENDIQKIEEENIDLKRKISVLKANMETMDKGDSQIENYLLDQIQNLEKEISKSQDEKRALQKAITDETIAFNEVYESFRQRELEAKRISAEIEAKGSFAEFERMKKEYTELQEENEKLTMKKESIEQNIGKIEQSIANVNASKEQINSDIHDLKQEGRALQEKADSYNESLMKTRGKLKSDPIVEILDKISLEKQEIISLERTKEVLEKQEIPALSYSIEIANAELTRISAALPSMKESYIISKIENLQKEIEGNEI